MDIQGIRPAPLSHNPPSSGKAVRPGEQHTHKPALSRAEQTTLHTLFSPSTDGAQTYQKLGQMTQRVRLGQYIDVKA
jgi:hypothetical protein